MTNIRLSKEEAGRFLIRYQGLDDFHVFEGEQGILEYIRRVGCIQYDPLDVTGRNADLILQSRIAGYSRAMLDKLLYGERLLIDGWDKMMSIYRREDWPFFHRIRSQMGKEVAGVLERRASGDAVKCTGKIRESLLRQGPLQPAQIKLGGAGKGRWGHRNLSGAAMDYMFHIGELGVYRKKGAQKIYDLIENLLPEELLNSPDPFANERDFLKWYVKRRVGSIGLLWERNGGGWLGFYLSDKLLRTSVLAELVEEQSLIPVSVEGINEAFYMRQEDAALLHLIHQKKEAAVRFLAPLDNLLWDRGLAERIFDFTYSWEVYLPVEKRKYGYYVLPVLYGNRFVARFEPERQRGGEPLRIKNWWWEEGIKGNKQMKADILEGFERFAQYLGTTFQKECGLW